MQPSSFIDAHVRLFHKLRFAGGGMIAAAGILLLIALPARDVGDDPLFLILGSMFGAGGICLLGVSFYLRRLLDAYTFHETRHTLWPSYGRPPRRSSNRVDD